MASDDLYRNGVTFLACLPEAVADWDNPTPDELNKQWDWTAHTGNSVTTGNTTKTVTFDPDFLVHNVTCAITETDTTFENSAHETSDDLGFCDPATRTNLTSSNPSVAFAFWRDADRAAKSLMNEVFWLLMKPDIVYYFVERLGDKASNVPFEEGDLVSVARMSTDLLVDSHAANAKVNGIQTTLNNGYSWFNHYLGA